MGTDEARESRPARSVEELLLAGLGWASLTVEAGDEIAEDLARRVGVDPGEMRAAVRDAIESWRRELERAGQKRVELSDALLARLGLARRAEVEELALAVAQLDHRLRLLEGGPGA
jgi:polyhydroxyalkanoate synthesis regulator phasin